MLWQLPANVQQEKPATRDSLSLAHDDCFFRAAAVRSPLLAYRFEAVLNQLSARSVRRSHPRSLSLSGKIHVTYPLPILLFSIPDRFQDRRSPPGYYTLGINALDPTPTGRLAFAIRPISVRSPCGVVY